MLSWLHPAGPSTWTCPCQAPGLAARPGVPQQISWPELHLPSWEKHITGCSTLHQLCMLYITWAHTPHNHQAAGCRSLYRLLLVCSLRAGTTLKSCCPPEQRPWAAPLHFQQTSVSPQDTPTQQSQLFCMDGTQAEQPPCFNPTLTNENKQTKKSHPYKTPTTKKLQWTNKHGILNATHLAKVPIYRQNTQLRTRSFQLQVIPLPCFPSRYKEEKIQPSKLFSSCFFFFLYPWLKTYYPRA